MFTIILGIITHSLEFTTKKIFSNSAIGVSRNYACHFEKPMQYCLWYVNNVPIASEDYNLAYIETSNPNRTCSITGIPNIDFNKNNVICAGIEKLVATIADAGNRLYLPCHSDTHDTCSWINNRNKFHMTGTKILQFKNSGKDCSLNITHFDVLDTGFWTCKLRDSDKIGAIHYISNKILTSNNFGPSHSPESYTKGGLANCNKDIGLIAALCVACIIVIILSGITIYLLKAGRNKSSLCQCIKTKDTSTIKSVNTDGTAKLTELIDPNYEVLYSDLTSAPHESQVQSNNHLACTYNENNAEKIYADVMLPESQSPSNEVPHISVGGVTYASVMRNK
ncbi:hypothetical protein CHUAL_003605 [Chamberlinius hualienensis]